VMGNHRLGCKCPFCDDNARSKCRNKRKDVIAARNRRNKWGKEKGNMCWWHKHAVIIDIDNADDISEKEINGFFKEN